MTRIEELHYSSTNTYLIEGSSGILLFDTGWAGSFPDFCRAMGERGIPVQKIDFILVSHFHPDHMGIVQEIADQGAVLLVPEVQKDFVHAADSVFAREKKRTFVPVVDERLRIFPVDAGREILKEIGIDGQVVHTPGHSPDSISLCLDNGAFFVGDLNPLYELELHKGTEIEKSWNRLLSMNPEIIYYGHARKAVLAEKQNGPGKNEDLYALVAGIIKLIDKGYPAGKIQKKTGCDAEFAEDVMRMYLTHQNIGVQGILDRIEIKNKTIG